jgi:hypothetical protein
VRFVFEPVCRKRQGYGVFVEGQQPALRVQPFQYRGRVAAAPERPVYVQTVLLNLQSVQYFIEEYWTV